MAEPATKALLKVCCHSGTFGNLKAICGTNSGSLNGMPVTGKRFSAPGVIIDRVHNGRITERWELGDLMTMMQQLGLVPMPEGM